MHNLPLACMSREVGHKLGASLGIMEAVDTEANDVGWGAYLRVKVSHDLSKPLARGRMLKFEGRSTLIHYQYEKLPRFCFMCEAIKHGREG